MGFWSGEKLLQRCQAGQVIQPFNEKAIVCAAYELTLGEYAFTTADDKDRAISVKPGETPGLRKLEQNGMFTIRPGQFAYLLTEEVVIVPDDAIGFISVKAGRKLDGLINVSGFHVDPGWSSRLVFGVFNAGPQELAFQRGERLFLLFLADLDPPEGGWPAVRDTRYVYQAKGKYDTLTSQMVQKMLGPVPSLYRVDKATKDLEQRIATLGSRSILATGTASLALLISLAMLSRVLGILPSAANVQHTVSGLFGNPPASPPPPADTSTPPPAPATAPSPPPAPAVQSARPSEGTTSGKPDNHKAGR